MKRLATCLLAILALGCGPGDSPDPAPSPEPSVAAGGDTALAPVPIEVAPEVGVSAEVVVPPGPVAAREVLRIGKVDGAPEEEMFRIFNLKVDSAGTHYVGLDGEIRVFDRTGRYVRTISRKGKGPGELNMGPRIWFTGDSIVAIDQNLMRTIVFNDEGRVLHNINLYAHAGLELMPLAANGESWLALLETRIDYEAEERNPTRFDVAAGEKYHRPPLAIVRYDPARDVIGDTIYRVPQAHLVGNPSLPNGAALPLFSPDPAYAFDGAGNFYNRGLYDYRIDVYDPKGAHVRTIRRAYTPIPITKADIDETPQRLVEAYSASVTLPSGRSIEDYKRDMLPRMKQQVERMSTSVPYQPTRPPLGRFLVSHGGTIAVERADARKPGINHAIRVAGSVRVPSRWDFFRSDGTFLGTADLPVGFRAFTVSDDARLTGVLRDEDNVEYVVTYETVRK